MTRDCAVLMENEVRLSFWVEGDRVSKSFLTEQKSPWSPAPHWFLFCVETGTRTMADSEGGSAVSRSSERSNFAVHVVQETGVFVIDEWSNSDFLSEKILRCYMYVKVRHIIEFLLHRFGNRHHHRYFFCSWALSCSWHFLIILLVTSQVSFLPSFLPGALTTRRHISRRSTLTLSSSLWCKDDGGHFATDSLFNSIKICVNLVPVRQGDSARFSTAMRRFTRNLGVLYCCSCLHRKWWFPPV